MNTDEYVLESKVEALEKRVNREAQQTMQHLLTLQKRIDELLARIESVDTVTNNVIDKVIRNVHRIETRVKEIEEEDHYKQPAQQSVADFERSQSLNALSRKPTPADIESEIAKSFMEWLRTQIPNSGLFSAFQAGVKFGMSKPLPNPPL